MGLYRMFFGLVALEGLLEHVYFGGFGEGFWEFIFNGEFLFWELCIYLGNLLGACFYVVSFLEPAFYFILVLWGRFRM